MQFKVMWLSYFMGQLVQPTWQRAWTIIPVCLERESTQGAWIKHTNWRAACPKLIILSKMTTISHMKQ